jgi:hypothetical protein
MFAGLALSLSACGWIGGESTDRPADLETTQWAFREEVDPLTDDQMSIAGRLIRSGPYAFEVEFSCRNGRLGTYRLTALDALGEPVPLHVEPDYLTGADSASATVRADLLPARTSDYVLDRFGNVFIFSATNMGREGMAELLRARSLTVGFKLADGDAIIEVDQANSAIQRALRPCARVAVPAEPEVEAQTAPATAPATPLADSPADPVAAAPVPAPAPAARPAPARPTTTRREEPARPVRPAAATPVRTATTPPRQPAPPRTTEPRRTATATRPNTTVRAPVRTPPRTTPAAPTPTRATVPAPARMAAASQGTGPSFSCADGLTRVERMICNDAELARLDRRMAALYEQSRANRGSRERVLREQRLFLADVGQCRNTSCVSSAYRARIAELAD